MIRERRVHIIIIVFILFSVSLHCNEISEYGLKVGINYSSYIGKGSSSCYWKVGSRDNDGKYGLTVGFYYLRSFLKNCLLQVEMSYSQKGAQTEYKSISCGSGENYRMMNSWKGNQNLIYIEVPVSLGYVDLFKFPFNHLPFCGISFSLLSEAKAKYDFHFVSQDEEGNITDEYTEKIISYDIFNSINSIDVQLFLGIIIPIENIRFDFRYSLNPIPINPHGHLRNSLLSMMLCIPLN